MKIEARLNGEEVSLPINSGDTGTLTLTTGRGRFEVPLPFYPKSGDSHLGLLAAAFRSAMVEIFYGDEGKVEEITVYTGDGSNVIKILDSGRTRRVDLFFERYKNKSEYR
jgi:hypothetical protein